MWQIDKIRFRNTLAGSTVTIHEQLDETVSIRYGPHVVGRYRRTGEKLISATPESTVEKAHRAGHGFCFVQKESKGQTQGGGLEVALFCFTKRTDHLNDSRLRQRWELEISHLCD